MTPETVGILSIGDMGSSIAAALADGGLRTVTLLEGRSDATRERATAAGVTASADPEAFVAEADVILSVVPPAAATDVARTVAAGRTAAGTTTPLLELNAIAPGTAETIAAELFKAGTVDDGCIIGPARDLDSATFYLAGPTAAEHGWLDRVGLETVVLGERVGQASGLKLCYAGMTKGLSVLGLDLLLGAVALGIEEPLQALYRDRLRSVADHLDHRLPGDPKRADRRSDELAAMADLMDSLDRDGRLFQAGYERLDWLASLGLDTDDAETAIETVRRIEAAAYDGSGSA